MINSKKAKESIHALPDSVCRIGICISALIPLPPLQLFTSLWRNLKRTSIPEVSTEAKTCQEKSRNKLFDSGSFKYFPYGTIGEKNVLLRLTTGKVKESV